MYEHVCVCGETFGMFVLLSWLYMLCTDFIIAYVCRSYKQFLTLCTIWHPFLDFV